jgi:uncharacterized protein (TIGR03437 family)
VTSFLTTDATVYLYFTATVTASDLLTHDWLAPDGTVIGAAAWGSNTGSGCNSASLSIADTPPNRLGAWQARVWANNALLFTVPFTISAPTTGFASQIITTIAGGGWRAFPTSAIPAMSAPLGSLYNLALDGQGNLYVADGYNGIVVEISPNGTLTLVAGNGNTGFSGDGGPATSASLNNPDSVAVDAAGNLYITDGVNNRIRMVSGGIITTVAGNGIAGFSGDGVPATGTSLFLPGQIALDVAGDLYIADAGNNRVRKISGGVITTIAGNGQRGFAGDGGPAMSASLSYPYGIALDSAGNLYIADGGNSRIRKVSRGIITTVAGNGTAGFSGDGGPATLAAINGPGGLAVDTAGNLLISEENNNRIRKVSSGIITTVAGNGQVGFSGDGGPATSASLHSPGGVVVDATGQIFIADYFNKRVRKVTGGTITSIAGNGTGTLFGDLGPATAAALFVNTDVAVDPSGNVYIADAGNNCIRRISGGIISTVAGTGVAGFSGDGGPATSASLNGPVSIAIDAAGNLYIADGSNNRIRKLSGGIITTVAGTGVAGFSGDGGPATLASLGGPSGALGVAMDTAGNLYIADTDNNRVRKISGGTITTVAGNGTAGFSGDGGPATMASLQGPQRLALDPAGNLFISDSHNNRVRKVSGGTITTVAGNGLAWFYGDGGPAPSASLDFPVGVAVDAAGELLIADSDNSRIRMVSGGVISTVAGGGPGLFAGDGGPAPYATLLTPYGVAVDGKGNLYIADTYNYRVREAVTTPPSYIVSPSSLTLTFSATAGGSMPPAQPISLSSTVPLGFIASPSASWLSISPSMGSMPASLQVNVDPSNLSAGTYHGTIAISAPYAAQPNVTIAVTAVVQSVAPAQLGVGTQNLSFTALQGSAAQTAQLQVSSLGGGPLSFSVTATMANGGSWLSVSPASGTVGASPAYVTVTANPSSLQPGTYQGKISVSGAGTPANVTVTFSVSAATAVILVSQSGLGFTAVAQGGSPLPQTFAILNTGQGSMNWSATAATLSGGANWLQISPASGTVNQPYSDVSTVTVSIDPTGLAAGDYYGRILVSSLVAANSPQLLTVILTVLPAGTNPGPEVRPTGLVFTGVAGATPGSQDVMIGSPKAGGDSYSSGIIGAGFTYLPTGSEVPANQATTLRVYPDFSSLQPGYIGRGTITLQFSDGTPRTVSVLLVVAPSASVTPSVKLAPRLSGGCPSQNLLVLSQSPKDNFTAVFGQATTLQVQVVDACGNPVGPGAANAAVVSATFSNQDAALNLTHIGNGTWTGTWKPVNPVTGQATVTVTAFNGVANGQASLSGTLAASQPGAQLASATPNFTRASVAQAASQAGGVPIAPGSLITIYGANLADAVSPSQNPTQVLLGNTPLPVLYAGPGQLNVQVPFNAPVNTQAQLSVQRGNVTSVPEQLAVAVAQPGVFTLDGTGSGPGDIFNSDGVTPAQGDTPASVGETVVIYATGLGPVTPAIKEGTPPPDSPLSWTANEVAVSIDGINAQVSYSGLTPGYPGLYQVNAVVPDGSNTGNPDDEVPVKLTVAGYLSPAVTMRRPGPRGGTPGRRSAPAAIK